jgi:putative transposase
MQRSKYTAEQMAQIIEECKLSTAKEVARRHGISDKTISNWKTKFKGMVTEDIRRYKQLEEECSRLKRLVARQAYDIECLKEINSKKW